ncbi:glycerophosphodiester phosphodiesterase [Duganella sp. Leaf126]|uniref:glycerophosphodiester phosphodiesterase n=1 Tax=Duganella sp. Leaf126 TaxID=1736266 RepID=UPI0006F1CD45|nr:glycerophosphodiester phosphodiesterase [Duganella sp. Leaf126]KQQ45310.1 glycerophosphodiester phosphodiesterase [Duganella sp. Leaf126]
MWPYPKIVAHRGGGTIAPENTVAGLRAGLAYGFRAVEFDVMLSRDGIGMVIHDPEFGRTVAGLGAVARTLARDLAAMDAGSWHSAPFKGEPVPYYTQFIAYCRQHGIWMNVEIKPSDGVEAATGAWVAQVTRDAYAQEIAAGQVARVPLLSSFSHAALAAARDAAPEVPRAWLLDRLPPDWQAPARALQAVAIHTNHRHLTQALAATVKAAGFGLFCYTVNDPDRARELLSWGVDGLCTDRIDLIGPTFT